MKTIVKIKPDCNCRNCSYARWCSWQRERWWLQVTVLLTLRTLEAGIPALRKLPCGVGSRYTGGTVCQRQAPEFGIPTLFSNAYRQRNARVIEIQTRQQLKNNFSHETQRIFVNKFCMWTPSGQRTS